MFALFDAELSNLIR